MEETVENKMEETVENKIEETKGIIIDVEDYSNYKI
jgi:DNA-directed RNA polymerase subunit E'/Rpb7